MVIIMTKIEPELRKLSKKVKRGGNPPAGHTLRPGQVICENIDMHIDSRGVWHYQGSPINRIELVKLFSTVLRRDQNDEHWLITPVEICKIDVIDAPFLVVELIVSGQSENQLVDFRTNIDQIFTLNDEHPLRVNIDKNTGEPSPYFTLDHGLEAKLSRPIYYELVDIGVSEDINGEQIYGVWSAGHFFPIDSTPDIQP